MPPVQHPYPGLFGPGKGIRAFTGRLRNGHPHPILINAQDGHPYPLGGRTTRCSSPTTPPAERRAYAAREQARKAKTHSSTSDTSERSISVPPQARHTHAHRGVHSRREFEPELEHLPHRHKHATRHHGKASKPVNPPRRPDSDIESHWSTNVHVPRTHHDPYHRHHHHHHHAAHLDHVVFKAPLNCQCPDCLEEAQPGHPQPVENTRDDPVPTKRIYDHHSHSFGTQPVPVDPRIVCSCGFVHAEPARRQSSRSTSPEKHRKGHFKHSTEPEGGRSHRHRHIRHRRDTTDSSSDRTNAEVNDTSSESDGETRTGGDEKGEYDLPSDWQFCNEFCCGHPVFYILR
ncbi:hypothetical protein PMG11_05017 [Penicillium brasilianum]|uniref:Uncharacterized protein n=1 Tax=Penicillium brasilianum TaxID=104259 RepID=A0A0F7VEB3_PENBI|nr:hypothetical protein PMG11_05017 [Penicillium brasilianum]